MTAARLARPRSKRSGALRAEERVLRSVEDLATDGRIPVVAATGSQSHAETVWLTEQADTAGADALLIVTPYYIKPSQRGLVEYFADLGRRSDLPLLVYHIPGRTAVSVAPATLEQIAEAAPTFVGLKHAVNDLGFVTEAIARLGPELRIFVGLEELSFPMLCLGASGLMNAVANLAPERVAALYSAVARGDLEAGRALHYELFELNTAVFFDTNPVPIKWMMKRMGLLASDEHRLPMVAADSALQARLEPVMQRAGLI